MVTNLEASKSFAVPGAEARLTFNPRYDVGCKSGDVTVAYDARGTSLEVDLSAEEQTVKLSQQLDTRNTLTPRFSVQSKRLAVEYERILKGGNSVTAEFKPDESLGVTWRDGEWTADIVCPVEGGYKIGGASVTVRRDVSF